MRLTLVVAVINVDASPFLTLSDLTCHLEDTGIGDFWLDSLDSKDTKLGWSNIEASPIGKDFGVVLMVGPKGSAFP